MFLYRLRVLPNEKNVSFYSDYRRGFLYFFSVWFIFVCQGCFVKKVSAFNSDVAFHYIRVTRFSSIFVFIVLVLFFLMLVVCNLCDKKRVPLRKLD